MVDETAFTLLDIASEILSGAQLEDFRTALHAAVSGYSCTVSEENLEILRQRGGIRCTKEQKASRIIGKLCKKYGVDKGRLNCDSKMRKVVHHALTVSQIYTSEITAFGRRFRAEVGEIFFCCSSVALCTV